MEDPRLALEEESPLKGRPFRRAELVPRKMPQFTEEVMEAALEGEKPSRMESLFEQALVGALPRSRELKPWEPDTLDAGHLQIIMMKATGISQRLIARRMGVSEMHVSIVVNHPDSQYLLAKMLSHAADNVFDVGLRMDAMLPEALDIAGEIMRNEKAPQALRAKIAFGLLDRRGYGKVEQKVVTSQIVVSERQGKAISTALRESRELVDVPYVVYTTPVAEQGSGVPPDPTFATPPSEDSDQPSQAGSPDVGLRPAKDRISSLDEAAA